MAALPSTLRTTALSAVESALCDVEHMRREIFYTLREAQIVIESHSNRAKEIEVRVSLAIWPI
jgi:hypothetical protein